MATVTKEEVINFIENMTVLELSQLVKELEDRFGVSPVIPAALSLVPVVEEAKPEEKTEFDAILASVGANKIQVIKVVRAITGLGLKEAKDLVEGAPKPVLEAVGKEAATEAKTKLEAAGGTVELQ